VIFYYYSFLNIFLLKRNILIDMQVFSTE